MSYTAINKLRRVNRKRFGEDLGPFLPEPFAGTYRTIGFATAGIEANIPLKWNRKVKVERYAEGEV